MTNRNIDILKQGFMKTGKRRTSKIIDDATWAKSLVRGANKRYASYGSGFFKD